MSNHHGLLTAALVLALAACAREQPLVRTETVVLPQRVYVGIPEELTKPCPIAEGTRAEVFEVARKRKEALEGCANADKAAIRALSEKAAKESGKP